MQWNHQSRVEAARGKFPCDLVLKNARYFDVFSGRFFAGDIAVHEGWVVGLDLGYRGEREIDLRGQTVVPGFIDAHCHIESSGMVPGLFERAVLPCGTTSVIADPHELANVQGVEGIEYFLKASEQTQIDLHVMMSSCVPATHLETNGGGTLTAKDLGVLGRHRNALGLAEVMNVPGVLNLDSSLIEKIQSFQGRPIDGHAPLLRGKDLSAYACAGMTSCHESSGRDEAEEKIRKGLSVWIREGSVAKDLHTLIPLLDAYRSASVGFCTDDRNPLDIAQEGHIDFLVREALKAGVAPETVYRSASWTVARHYGLDRTTSRRADRWGAIAPGYVADLVVLEDVATAAISSVFKRGVPVDELAYRFPSSASAPFINSVRAQLPEAHELEGPTGNVHVIQVQPGKIITGREIADSKRRGIQKLSVLGRHGQGRPPVNAYVSGFGENFKGAIASSVGHDSHNLIVVGSNTDDMRVALARLIGCGGGFCVAQGGAVVADLPLPVGGLMSDRPIPELIQSLKKLREASQALGCELFEPFLQLAFLSLPVIPSLKLTDLGLVDVDRFEIISVRA